MRNLILFFSTTVLLALFTFSSCVKDPLSGEGGEVAMENMEGNEMPDIFSMSTAELIQYHQSNNFDNAILLRGGEGPASPTLGNAPDCSAEPACITGVELLELYPENPNYIWRVDIVRTSNTILTSEQYWNLPISQQCELTILTTPFGAGILQSEGINAMGLVPNIAYPFPYYENENYWMLATLSPNGDGAVDPEDFVRLRFYHKYGWECIALNDLTVEAPASILANTKMWATTTCDNENPSGAKIPCQ